MKVQIIDTTVRVYDINTRTTKEIQKLSKSKNIPIEQIILDILEYQDECGAEISAATTTKVTILDDK